MHSSKGTVIHQYLSAKPNDNDSQMVKAGFIILLIKLGVYYPLDGLDDVA